MDSIPVKFTKNLFFLAADKAAASSSAKDEGVVVKTPRLDTPDSDALSIYMRQMANSPVLSLEEETRYSKKYDEFISQFRIILYSFAFVARDHLAVTDEITIDGVENNFVFLFDENAKAENPAEEILLDIKGWSGRISKALEKLNSSFKAGDECAGCREKLATVLTAHLLKSETVKYDPELGDELIIRLGMAGLLFEREHRRVSHLTHIDT